MSPFAVLAGHGDDLGEELPEELGEPGELARVSGGGRPGAGDQVQSQVADDRGIPDQFQESLEAVGAESRDRIAGRLSRSRP